ncbi:porin family protein [Pseudomonas sp. MWU12-2037]|uniref:porin family protein n=1 Tax=Pseudomonas sp. MWU12-2037 TaxID=2928690 RepID=UPI00200D336E|nr:porin family protein [Pseudomonas sp. MWU12-2037]
MFNRLTHLFIKSSALAVIATPMIAMAAPSIDPISQFGVLGSYSHFKLEGGSQSEKSHMPTGGLFYNFGNKMTAESGLIYQAGVEVKYGKNDDNKLKEGQGDLDLGWRAALDSHNFFDVIVGGGYSWTRYEPDSADYDIKLTGRSPFAKAALGYNHQFDAATMRVEAGVRRSIGSEGQIRVAGEGSDTVDLKDHTNPYAEVNFLFNQQSSLPIVAGVYYTHTEFKLDGDSDLADNTKLKIDEYGAKVGIAF